MKKLCRVQQETNHKNNWKEHGKESQRKHWLD